MAETIGTAYVQVEPSFDGVVPKIDKEFGGAGKESGSSFSSGFASAMKGFGAITAASGAAIGAMGAKFVSATADVASYGDNIDKMSQKMGLTAEAYQEWDAVMQHSGTSMETMKASMKTLANAAETGNKAFAELGITQKDIQNMNQQELFEATISGLQNVTDDTQRTYLAGKLLGRGATELGALLNTSAEDTQAMRDRVRELGGVMSQDAVSASAAFQDQLQDMQTSFQGLTRGLTAEFLPSMTMVMSGLTEIFSGNTEGGLGQISEGVNGIVDGITQALPQIAQTATQIIEALGSAIISNLPQLISVGFNILTELVSFIIQNMPLLIQAGVQIITELANGIAQALPTLIPTIVDVIMQIIDTLVQNAPMLIDAAVQLMLGLADGIVQAIPVLISYIPQIITSLVDALITGLPMLIQGAIQLVIALVQAIPQIITALIEALPQIIQTIADALPVLVPALIEGAIQLVIALVAALPQIIAALIEAVPQIIDALVQAFTALGPALQECFTTVLTSLAPVWDKMKEYASRAWEAIKGVFGTVGNFFKTKFLEAVNNVKTVFSAIGTFFQSVYENIISIFSGIGARFKEVGSNLVAGLKNGIAGSWDKLKEWLSNLFGDLVELAKKILGIESPSKVFRDEVGHWIPLGIGAGIEEGMGALKKKAVEMRDEMLSSATITTQIGSTFTAPSVPEISDSSDNRTLSILAEYLPVIAREISRPIEVKQNDRGTFEAVRRQNNTLVTATGYHALA